MSEKNDFYNKNPQIWEMTERVKKLLLEQYHHPAVFIKTYGCQQNVSDGEKIKGLLASMGYEFADSPENADLVLFNTCAIRENAEVRVFGNKKKLSLCRYCVWHKCIAAAPGNAFAPAFWRKTPV